MPESRSLVVLFILYRQSITARLARVPNPVSLKSDKVLLILDDEKSYTDLLAQLLADHLDCPIRTFSRPLAALEALPSLDVGLIVTDYYMPQISGIEFIRRVQRLRPQIPVVMITGHRMELEETDYSDVSSLKAVLAKPLNWRRLAEEIERHWAETAQAEQKS